MVRDMPMPKFGLTMTEGLVAEWRVEAGAAFKAGDVLLVVETEKMANEVEAQADGVLVEVIAREGQTIACGEPIARWSAPGEAGPAAAPAPTAAAPTRAPTQVQASPVEARAATTGRVIATPLARRRARDLGVDLAALAGSGPRGRIKAIDVEGAATKAAPAAAATAPAPAGGARRRASSIQRTMAKRLAETKAQVPHFYLAAEAEVSALTALRARLNAQGPQRLSVTPFILAAVGRALVDLPAMDAVWDAGEIVTLGEADVGLAIDSPRGLVVPIVRGAGRKALGELGAETSALVAQVKESGVTIEQCQGGAVTVSNAGMHNVSYMTSIINPGQSTILGVGSVRELFRPDSQGAPALRRELGLVLSADHRMFDGVSALRFLNAIIDYLETPERLLEPVRG